MGDGLDRLQQYANLTEEQRRSVDVMIELSKRVCREVDGEVTYRVDMPAHWT